MLFDIDGTLVDTGGLGRVAFRRALERVTGVDDDLAYVAFAGNTDLRVLDQVMARRGRPLHETEVLRIFQSIAEELRHLLAARPARMIPGADAFLERLAERGAALGLVTGNIRECAYIKLASVELDHHFDFGGFGDDHPDRAHIARAALDAARSGGHHPGRGPVCLVGDTLMDVAAGKALGLTVIGVATGHCSPHQLLEGGADLVVEDFCNVPRLLEGIENAFGQGA